MFYRLLKISAWARRHPKLAILVIILLQTIFILLSLYLGHLLRQYGYVLGRPFLFVGFMLIIDGIFLFPHRDELKEIFVNPRKLWVKIIASTFIFVGAMILLMGYAGKKEFKTDSGQGLITKAYAIETAPHLTVTQSQLERDYATKFIVKLNPGETAKTLGFWRELGLVFIVLFVLGIIGVSAYLMCSAICADNIIFVALIAIDSFFLLWGVVSWFIKGALTKRHKYNWHLVIALFVYASMFLLYFLIPERDFYAAYAALPMLPNLLISLMIFYWGRNKPLFGAKNGGKGKVIIEERDL